MTTGKIPTKMVLGVPIAALRLKEISPVVINLIEEGGKARYKAASGKARYHTGSGKARYRLVPGKKTFFYVDTQCLNIANKDPLYKKILQKATFVHAAGIGPILASRILGRTLPERIPTPDFISEVFVAAEKKRWSFYLLGGKEDVVQKAAERIQKKFPKLKIAGVHHGYFNDDKVVVEKINRARPDIILVGMGKPRQEKWIADNIDNVNASIFWAVGAIFDFFSGKRSRAPKFMQRLGLEWAFRLFQEPRRLWKRYLFGNIGFLFTVFQELKFFSRKSSH